MVQVHYGPMRLRNAFLIAVLLAPCAHGRDLSVFNVLRLEMPDAHSSPAPRDTWSVDVQLGYQNTWSMSPNIQDYFETRGVRRRLSAADIADISALPFEKFLVDLEMGVADVTLHRRLGPNWSVYGILSAVTYNGGFLDAPVERFHSALGFREYVRTAVPRNSFTVIAELKDTHYVLQDAPTGGLLDPTLGVRYTSGRLALDGAIKVPLGGARPFLSNGHFEYGVQATAKDSWGPHTAWGSLAVVRTHGGGIVDTHGGFVVPTATAGYEYAFGERASAFVQGHVSRYALDSRDTDIGGLRQPKTQVSVGARYRTGASTFSVSFIEGFGAYNGLPDLGLNIGWTLEAP